MIIPLTLPSQSSPSQSGPALPHALAQLGSSELFLLELQGELEVSGTKHGQLVGRLTLDDDGKGKPTLRIGHHLLEGKVVSLPKPLAVLQRVRAPPAPNPRLARDGDGDGDEDVDMRHLDEREADVAGSIAAPATTSYAIRTLVRKKLVFSKRPTPIVGLSAKNTV